MKLSRIVIKNFRRIEYVDLNLNTASFIIGPNNVGKTSVIKAIEALLSLSNTIKPDDFRVLSDGQREKEIEICGYFTDIDATTAKSRGFKGRVIDGQYIYKKTFDIGSTKAKIWTLQYHYTLKDEFKNVSKWNDLIEIGFGEETLTDLFGSKPSNGKLSSGWEFIVEDAVVWDFESEPKYIENPGGIASNVASKLPRLVHIPSYANVDDIGKADGNKTLLGECLGILFEDLLSQNELAASIQGQLTELQTVMSPDNSSSLISGLCEDVNSVIDEVFPGCGIKISPSLQDLNSVLKPKYEVEMFSNVNTSAEKQGTGLVRTGIFSMLRYHSHLKAMGEAKTRPLLVAFEEPEIYLHPAAANLLRDTIYSLGETDQIICSTHSPWMIDLSKDWLSLTKLYTDSNGYSKSFNYGLNDAVDELETEEKELLKMVKTFDDELSRIFFADRCVIVEGDSEVIAIKNTLKVLDASTRKDILSKTQVIKARGKATIIPLVKYLKKLSVPIYVIHDRDRGVAGAEKFNLPIVTAVGNSACVSVLEECLEECLGYQAPSSDKPFRTHLETSKWKEKSDIPESWKTVFQRAFECII
ncbi:AAA family ATPase [Paenibacillaceae sp. P-4]|uniref:ATP-dependent nuclease n=1 Tax=Paenibacillaceae bacterium P-4 TaxID=3160969 RepID=UPI0032E83B7C